MHCEHFWFQKRPLDFFIFSKKFGVFDDSISKWGVLNVLQNSDKSSNIAAKNEENLAIFTIILMPAFWNQKCSNCLPYEMVPEKSPHRILDMTDFTISGGILLY